MTITLKNLHEATPQQVFDQAVHGLLKQGEKSISVGGEGECKYRTPKPDGTVLKCAAGMLIADEEYTERMDNLEIGAGWRTLVKEGLVPTEAHRDLIEDLQEAHDTHDVEQWEKAFQYVAQSHGLAYTWPVAKNFAVIRHEEEPCF